MNLDSIFQDIRNELSRAQAKHPNHSADAAVIAEELGEWADEALALATWSDEGRMFPTADRRDAEQRAYREAVQVMTMFVRRLVEPPERDDEQLDILRGLVVLGNVGRAHEEVRQGRVTAAAPIGAWRQVEVHAYSEYDIIREIDDA